MILNSDISEDEATCEDKVIFVEKIITEAEHGSKLLANQTENYPMKNDSDFSENEETIDDKIDDNKTKVKARYLCPVSFCTFQLFVDDVNLQRAHLSLKHSSMKPIRFLAM